MTVANDPSLIGQTHYVFTPGSDSHGEATAFGDCNGMDYHRIVFHPYQVTFLGPYAIGTGNGVMNNYQSHIDTYISGRNYRLEDVTRRANNDPHGHHGQMRSDQSIHTFRFGGPYPGIDITDTDTSWTNNYAYVKPGVDAQVYAGQFYDYLLSEFQRNSYDDTGSSMISTVEDTVINNSRWSPNLHQVFYGSSGSHRRSFARCLEVTGHEFSHGVTGTHPHMLPYKEAGALDESFSNMMGVTFRYVRNNRPAQIDWSIGATSHDSVYYDAEMSMSDPIGQNIRLNLHRPDFYDSLYWFDYSNCNPYTDIDHCGIHTNSGVPDKMFYFLSVGGTSGHNGVVVQPLGIENAMKVMYWANLYRWTVYDSTFLFARRLCIDAADSMPGGGQNWAAQTANAWNAVGVGDHCAYIPGDINGDGAVTASDITYFIEYMKGNVPAMCSCDLAYRVPYVDFYASADCNGNCLANGIDVTYLVKYFQGIYPDIRWCLHFTPGQE